MQHLTKRVEENYRGHLVLDSLSVAEEGSSRRGRFASQAVTGFPLGVSKKYTGNGQTFINNHLAFTILYHEHVPAVYIATEEEPADSYRIVGFQVTPMSVDHAQSPCDDKFNPDTTQPLPTTSEHVTWTYSVSWAESEIEWSTRWDVYLKASIAESRIHWLSIVNSSLVVVLLSVVIAIILIRALKRDLARYNSPEAMEEEREETGWKLVHGDVFRKPEGAGLLYIYVGTGVQLLGMCASTIGIAVLGFLSPANRGGLLTTLIFLFVLLGSFCGYTTARLAKMHKMTSWKLAITSGVYFPGQMFLIYFMLNFVHWGVARVKCSPVHVHSHALRPVVLRLLTASGHGRRCGVPTRCHRADSTRQLHCPHDSPAAVVPDLPVGRAHPRHLALRVLFHRARVHSQLRVARARLLCVWLPCARLHHTRCHLRRGDDRDGVLPATQPGLPVVVAQLLHGRFLRRVAVPVLGVLLRHCLEHSQLVGQRALFLVYVHGLLLLLRNDRGCRLPGRFRLRQQDLRQYQGGLDARKYRKKALD